MNLAMLAGMKDLSVKVLAAANISIDSPFAIVLARDEKGTHATLEAKMHTGKGLERHEGWVKLQCSSIQAVGYFARPKFIVEETLEQLGLPGRNTNCDTQLVARQVGVAP